MLLREHGGGREDGDLFAFHNCLEGGANRDLGLAKPDIAANQPIHGARLLHVALGGVDGFELIGRLAKRKRVFEFALPFCVGTEGVAELRFTLRLHREHLARVIEDGSGRIGFGARPFRVRERTEPRRFFSHADITGDEVGLLERDVKTGVSREFEREHLLLAAADRRHFGELQEAADAVLEMHDEVALVQFAEIDLCPVACLLFRALQSPAAVGGGTAEEFRRGKDDQVASGEIESAREGAFGQLDAPQRIGGICSGGLRPPNAFTPVHALSVVIDRRYRCTHDFAEALDFALRLEVNDDGLPGGAPFREACGELCTFRLHQHEVAHGKFRDVGFLKRTGVIFFSFLQPSFADENLRVVVLLRLDGDAQVFLCDVIVDRPALLLSRAEKEIDRLQLANGRLRVEVELAKRFDFIVEKLDAHGQLRLPGIEIKDAAADGELPARAHLRNAFVAGAG